MKLIASNTSWLILIPTIVLAIGLVLSLCGYVSAFQRSGSLLVCFAVLSVYLNHFLSIELKRNKKIFLTLGGLGGVQDRINETEEILKRAAYVQANNSDLEEGEALEIAVNSFLIEGKFEDDYKNIQPKLQIIKERIVTLEFLSGLLGTLVWGFGDLPFTLQCCA